MVFSRRFKRMLFALFFVATLTSSWPRNAWALFDLSVSPRRGGQSIRFENNLSGDAIRNEEVTFTMTSDRAIPYQIVQNMVEPLTNEKGQSLPTGSFFVFSPSRPAGTLRTQLETPISMGQFPVYVSNTSGDSDEFILVFNIHVPEDQPGGIYRTRISYTAEPVNAQPGLSPSTTTLEVRLELESKFRVTVQSSAGARTLDLGAVQEGKTVATGTLHVAVDSSLSDRFRLVMQLPEPLTSDRGEVLEEGAVLVSGSGNRKGILNLSPSPVPLENSSLVIYRSSESSGGQDNFEVVLNAAPPALQKSGRYTSTLIFRVETDPPLIAPEPILVPLQLDIKSIFSIETKAEEGQGLYFGQFRQGEERKEKRVELKVSSNLGEPYQVTQVVSRKMTSDDGSPLPNESFQVKVDEPKSGIARVSGYAPVEEGETVLYTSDGRGAPEDLLVQYALEIPSGTKAGSYTSEIKYSITTL